MTQVDEEQGTPSAAHAAAGASTASSDSDVTSLGVSPCDVGWEVRRLRLAAGWTQDELARRSATSQPAIAHLESGRRMPMLTTLERLAAALGRDLVLMLPSRESVNSMVVPDRPRAASDGEIHAPGDNSHPSIEPSLNDRSITGEAVV